MSGSTVLVTGFVPFGAEDGNPSRDVAEALDATTVAGAQVVGLVLPVEASGVEARIRASAEEVEGDVVLHVGLAGGRPAPALERVALNVLDFPIPDNTGARPVDEPVVPGGPTAYLTGLPVKAVMAAWAEAGIAGYLSNTAGTYVCNQTYYLSSHLRQGTGCRVGLLHLPYAPEQARQHAETSIPPSTPVEVAVAAARLALETTLRHSGDDLRLPGGAVS